MAVLEKVECTRITFGIKKPQLNRNSGRASQPRLQNDLDEELFYSTLRVPGAMFEGILVPSIPDTGSARDFLIEVVVITKAFDPCLRILGEHMRPRLDREFLRRGARRAAAARL